MNTVGCKLGSTTKEIDESAKSYNKTTQRCSSYLRNRIPERMVSALRGTSRYYKGLREQLSHYIIIF